MGLEDTVERSWKRVAREAFSSPRGFRLHAENLLGWGGMLRLGTVFPKFQRHLAQANGVPDNYYTIGNLLYALTLPQLEAEQALIMAHSIGADDWASSSAKMVLTGYGLYQRYSNLASTLGRAAHTFVLDPGAPSWTFGGKGGILNMLYLGARRTYKSLSGQGVLSERAVGAIAERVDRYEQAAIDLFRADTNMLPSERLGFLMLAANWYAHLQLLLAGIGTCPIMVSDEQMQRIGLGYRRISTSLQERAA